MKYAIFPADDGTFSITLAVPLAVQRLKVLAQTPAFDAMVRATRRTLTWVAEQDAEALADAVAPYYPDVARELLARSLNGR